MALNRASGSLISTLAAFLCSSMASESAVSSSSKISHCKFRSGSPSSRRVEIVSSMPMYTKSFLILTLSWRPSLATTTALTSAIRVVRYVTRLADRSSLTSRLKR